MIKILNKILDSIGYYTIKKRYRDNQLRKRVLKEDAARRENVLLAIDAMAGTMLQRNNDTSDIIVSLTSYGKRVSETLPYTLYSLLVQTVKPNRIIVWLDEVNWNADNMPDVLKKLQTLGIEFGFCEDIRSYKKLIPTLKLYPHNVIITVDDDLYYNGNLVKWLTEAYKSSDKRTILGTVAERVTHNDESGLKVGELCLIGCGGILYPPDMFDEEIFKQDLFMRLAPTADDFWFWIMEKRLGIRTALISQQGYQLHTDVNRINYYFPEESPDNLFYFNELAGNNNEKQLKNLLKYYNINKVD